MGKKVFWLTVSCVMVLSLVLASCAPATSPEEKPVTPPAEEKPVTPPAEEKPVTPPAEKAEPETVKVRLTKADGTIVEKSVEKPKYGGVLKWCWHVPPLSFDEVYGLIWAARTMPLTNEGLMRGDWAKGPIGTGEASYYYYLFPPPHVVTGAMAESWERPDDNTLVYHIRKGVHFSLNPESEASRLVNGREMTAEDVAFTLVRLWTEPMSMHYNNYPWKIYFEEKDGGPSIMATDKWTVVLKCKPGKLGYVYEISSQVMELVPPEVIKKYGDLRDWRNSVGTGAFMLVDYVADSSITLVRNPNYYLKDDLFPENQLPYLDGIKIMIIPDISTRLAAVRTGKVDEAGGYSNGSFEFEDAESLMMTNPHLKWSRMLEYPTVIFMRVDNPELPYSDIRVRQALNMAIDKKALAEDYYRGHALQWTMPVMPIPELMDLNISFDELPESIKEIYTYNPEKAKKLLAEAGFPEGFKTSILTTAAGADLASVFKAYLAKIAVDMELDVKEYAVLSSLVGSKSHKEMYLSAIASTIPIKFMYWIKGNYYNYSMVNDPVIYEAYEKVTDAYFDRPQVAKLIREITPYLLEQAHHIIGVSRYTYTFWQPWLKGYNGEIMIGYNSNWGSFPRYVWLDQDLKEEMTGTR